MPALGSIEPYYGIYQFDSYIERLEHYFVANSIGDFPTGASVEVIQSVERGEGVWEFGCCERKGW